MLKRRELLLTSAALALSCAKKSSTTSSRAVSAVIPSQPTKDGAGVSLNRALGNRALGMLDPFLMLDEFQTENPDDYIAGFPDHPHRGFETVTYMIHGAMEHKDSVGNQGRLRPGSAQWMTAGRGIVHSEMPKQERGLMWGFQLWVNLPAQRKMIPPRYQDIAPEVIPELALERGRVRVIAGSVEGKTGPVSGIDVEPLFLDVTLEKGGSLTVPTPARHNSFVFVTDGAMRVGSSREEVKKGHLAVLSAGEVLRLDGEQGRALVLAGRPLGEPVSRWGPFVMNTDDEIKQAIEDYRSGRLTL
ncbi:MAG: pirin family protein [Archangium sp.]|nr:pirin family protein [Archangium sp.]MDP3154351.1 pirin family protein [Archangium sp.]MDP3573044.1 pirin family protein [Archangium sp.]